MAIPSFYPSQANLKAFYELNDVNDSSGNGYNLTNNNTVTFTSAKKGNGANFSTTNTNKSLTTSSNLGVARNISVSFFVKILTEISDSNCGFCSKFGDATASYTGHALYYNDPGGTKRLYFRLWKGGVGYNDGTYECGNLGTANWYHMSYSYDGTNSKLYLNGELVITINDANTGISGVVAGLEIGRADASIYGSCLIDEFAVYNTALSQENFKQIINGYKNKGGFSGFSPWVF